MRTVPRPASIQQSDAQRDTPLTVLERRRIQIGYLQIREQLHLAQLAQVRVELRALMNARER